MNDIAGHSRKFKENEVIDDKCKKPINECEKQLSGFLATDFYDSTNQQQQKKFFSFLKWFKNAKENSNWKSKKNSSTASTFSVTNKKNSSCESIDTIFSTETVRSFAYIPPTQYQPSAPSSSLLDLDGEEKTFRRDSVYDCSKETEFQQEKKRKRKAPDPPNFLIPRMMRENSLPNTLERKCDQTFHRRTVSESFKDKKAGAYRHVQGKKKAPLPPPKVYLYPNLQKLNPNYSSLHKKKKPAPLPPPQSKPNGQDNTNCSAIQNGPVEFQEETLNRTKPFEPSKTQEAVKSTHEKSETKTKPEGSSKKENFNLSKVPVSPLPSRPWYKRSHKDSSVKNLIKKDLLKGLEKKKNKEYDDWMPEVGFSRNLSLGGVSNKFMLLSKTEKSEDKKKEEKRKSQISILTNISELDKEAAEILRKEQAEEKKMRTENDAKYYSPSIPSYHSNHLKEETIEHKKLEKITEKTKVSDSNVVYSQSEEPKREVNNEVDEMTEDNHRNQLKIEKNLQKSTGTKRTGKPNKNFHLSSDPIKEENSPAASINSAEAIESKADPAGDLNHFKVRYFNEPWVCSKCTLENPGWRVFCEICSSVKPHFLYNSKPNMLELNKNVVTQPLDNTKSIGKDEENDSKEVASSNLKAEKNEKCPTAKSHAKEKVKISEGDKAILAIRNSEILELDKSEAAVENKNSNPPINESTGLKLEKKAVNNLFTKDDSTYINQKRNSEICHGSQRFQGERTEKESLKDSGISVTPREIRKKDRIPNKQIPSSVSFDNKSNNKVIEAYVITQTTVLEDIVVKKKDKNADASEKDNIIRLPSRTQKDDAFREKQTLKHLPEREDCKFKLSTPINSTTAPETLREDIVKLTNKLTRSEELEDIKANIRTMASNPAVNTVIGSKLLRKLEAAINGGDQSVAAELAKKLAQLDINCSVTRQEADSTSDLSKITIDIFVEDKESHRGPIQIQVSPSMTLLQLKEKAHQELGIPANMQRWILGKTLATDDDRTLESDGIRQASPVFLYLVSPDKNGRFSEETNSKEFSSGSSGIKTDSHYGFKKNGFPSTERSGIDGPNEDILNEFNEKPVESFKSSERANFQGRVKEPDLKKANIKVSSKENENDLEKELKPISGNSVKLKVAKLNKTFEESKRKENFSKFKEKEMKISFNWKCSNCAYTNPSERRICLVCSAEKQVEQVRKQIPKPGTIQEEMTESDVNEATATKVDNKATSLKGNNFHYEELVKLQDADLVTNLEPFHCLICFMDCSRGEGIILKDCLHTFCRPCLINTVRYSEDAEVKCPYFDETYSCTSVLQQREIKALVSPKIFDQHLANSIKEAQNKMENAFYCKTPDCKGWCIYEDNVNEFHCPVCNLINCLTCHAIHTGIDCKQYQQRMRDAADTDTDAKKTKLMLDEMVNKGEAMACPQCQVVLMKKWGCDWLRCSMCKTEICWVTRGFRWGPAGKGDTSGGCKCGVKGIKCHPKCTYCH